MTKGIDILENDILSDFGQDVLDLLLIDQSKTNAMGGEIHNIFWATQDYEERGEGYEYYSEIKPKLITDENNGFVIMPRVAKEKQVQASRVKKKAEVFTPSWVCNFMINNIDEREFGSKSLFNIESEDKKTWQATTEKIVFPNGKTWMDYVMNRVTEITCGEAPFLVSRYDATTGEPISIERRIGVLDRKLRVVNENTKEETEWFDAACKAYQNTLAYEWQGDSLLIARENLLYTFIDNYKMKFGKQPRRIFVKKIAEIISWNIWQMDGLKGVIPNSCHEVEEKDIFGNVKRHPCPGCAKKDYRLHNGIPCLIKSWPADLVFSYNEIKDAIKMNEND